MAQSEELMRGVEFTSFSVDLNGFNSYFADLMRKHSEQALALAQLGLVKYNSSKETKAWLESFGIDCSRGSGKDVYLHPTNISSHPTEMKCLAEMKRLEALRRKFVSTEKLFVSVEI